MERHELERLYPENAFAEDRNRNARTEAQLRHGLLVLPGAARRVDRHAGEVDDAPGTRFLAPQPEEGYREFLDRALILARTLSPPEGDDDVLQGLRQ
jgi:hypothetical protein